MITKHIQLHNNIQKHSEHGQTLYSTVEEHKHAFERLQFFSFNLTTTIQLV
jgi:hypothetical protein